MFNFLSLLLLFVTVWSAKVTPGTDLQAQLDEAIARGDGQFVIPKGIYDFKAGQNLVVNSTANLIITGNSPDLAILRFAPGYGLAILNCTNVGLSGVRMDSSVGHMYSQGTITAVDPTRKQVTLHVAPGFPSPDPAETPWFRGSPEVKVIYWNATSKTIVHGQPGYTGMMAVEKAGASLYRLTLNNMDYKPTIGDSITVSARVWSNQQYALPTYYHGALTIAESASVSIRNVEIVAGSTFAVLEWAGQGGHVYDGLRIKRPEGSSGYLSVCLDGFHSFSVQTGATVQNCTIEHVGDDFFNVHNRAWLVTRVRSDSSVLIADPGDIIGFHSTQAFNSSTASFLGTAQFIDSSTVLKFYNSSPPFTYMSTATASKTAVMVTDGTELQRAIAMFAQIKTTGILPAAVKVYSVPLSSVEGIVEGALVQDDSLAGTGAIIRNNRFFDSYDNSMRLQASNVIVENNTFKNSQSGINVQFDEAWLEGSLDISNVSIVSNHFVNVGHCCSNQECFHVDQGVANVKIDGNTFSQCQERDLL